MRDTTILEAKIAALQQEIADDQKHVSLLKDNIATNKQVLKVYQKGLKKLKEDAHS